jgi:hypothetical protein
MARRVERLRRFFIIVIIAAACAQWAIVLERATAAAWTWYKFVGYGGGGHIVVGRTIQVIFILGSAALAAVGHWLWKVESRADSSTLWLKSAQLGWTSIAVCTLFWIILLATPLVIFERS